MVPPENINRTIIEYHIEVLNKMPISEKAQSILDFWFKETPPKKRFQKHKDFDSLIKEKFLKDLRERQQR